MAHGVTPEALERGAAPRRPTPAPPGSSRRPTTGWPPTSPAAPRSARPRASRSSSTSRGARTSASTPTCRRRALQQGADAVLTSTHKIVGSLTQSAMLHVAPTGRIDPDAVARAVRLVRSTSPSSLLMASLDAARRQLVIHGQALLSRTIAASDARPRGHRRDDAAASSARSSSGTPGVAGWDPLRIVIDVRATGCSGYEVAAALRSAYDIHVELATHATMVLVLGLRQPEEALDRFAHDFATDRAPDRAPGRRRGARAGLRRARQRGRGAAARGVPRRGRRWSPVDAAVGRVSAESIAGYPPGIPALLPGERITAEARRLPARAARVGRAPARRERPGLPHHRRALRHRLNLRAPRAL